MAKENLFRKAIANRQQAKPEDTEFPEDPTPLPQPQSDPIPFPSPQPVQEVQPVLSQPAPSVPKRRGRPATGKRSDDAWIGRTFYIQRETDLDAESELLNLKRQGIEIDKSELVDKLLTAWVKWRQGENIEIHLSEISPIQKSKNS